MRPDDSERKLARRDSERLALSARARVWPVLVLALAACDGKSDSPHEEPLPPVVPLAPAAPPGPVGPAVPSLNAAQRLTTSQYRAAIRDLFGPEVVVPPALEPDVTLDGFDAIGASKSAVSARGVEQYEAAAFSIGAQIAKTPALLARVAGCTPKTPLSADDGVCAKSFASSVGRRVWRRPLSPDEVATLTKLVMTSANALGGFERGVELGVAALLQSPHFLYRPSLGEPDPERPARKRLTGYELATRLALFLWNTVPDDALLDAAGTRKLDTFAGVAAEVDRMLASPKAREGLRTFVSQWLGLGALDGLQKDAKLFTYFSPELGPMAREETLRVFDDLVFDRDADVRDVVTTRHTFVTPKLASMYQVRAPAPDAGFAPLDFPETSLRRGLLGHVSILSLYAHPTSSSATLRGKFVREKLLCQTMPAPPVDVNTALPEPTPSARTLRDRVKVHQQVPRCAACHVIMDPIGLGLEPFDGIGRYRAKENGATIDPTGDLDGVKFADPRGLAKAVHDHRDFGPCIARRVYQYATGLRHVDAEEPTIKALTAHFIANGYRLKSLLAAVATSPAFRLLGEPH